MIKSHDQLPQRYFFDQDDCSHWYMIPEEWRDEWIYLNELPEGWDHPEWQKFEDCRLDGGINYITFENPIGND
jgi:hypothetical protein